MDNTERYKKKENYKIDYSVETRLKHINTNIIKENQDHIKGNCLFVGCNGGSTVYILSDYCDHVVGYDINKEAINSAKELCKSIKNVSFICNNIVENEMEKFSFDTIFLFDVYEHIFNEDVPKLHKQLNRLLKDDGSILILIPRAVKGSIEDKTNTNAFDPVHTQFFYDRHDIKSAFNKDFNIMLLKNDIRRKVHWDGNYNYWFVILKKKEAR